MAVSEKRRLFCFGFGYCAEALARALAGDGWRLAGTCRGAERRRSLAAAGYEVFLFDKDRPLSDAALAGTTHLLASVPPGAEGDPVLAAHAGDIGRLPALVWVGYLSTTGVYGDHGGAWVDETTPPNPSGERGRWRLAAEMAWLGLGRESCAAQVFRLAGIYGPGRSQIDAARAGTAKRIDKPGQVFSRIHVADVVATLRASMARPDNGRAYNVCDDEPAPSAEVVAHACRRLGLDPPALIPFEAAELSPLGRSFYADNRRVRNRRIKTELGVRLRYPDYRHGLDALLAAES